MWLTIKMKKLFIIRSVRFLHKFKKSIRLIEQFKKPEFEKNVAYASTCLEGRYVQKEFQNIFRSEFYIVYQIYS